MIFPFFLIQIARPSLGAMSNPEEEVKPIQPMTEVLYIAHPNTQNRRNPIPIRKISEYG
jgi:hypothetical protein